VYKDKLSYKRFVLSFGWGSKLAYWNVLYVIVVNSPFTIAFHFQNTL